MRIDYSIKPSSKYFLFIDVPFRQSFNHISLALLGKGYGVPLDERIKHFAIGILKCIPCLGHAIALIDTLRQKISIMHLKLTSTDPFKRGEEHGLVLKNRIKEVYEPILGMIRQKKTDYFPERVEELEKQIPPHLKDEMKGLAKGSGYTYEDVLLIHTFLDARPGQFGCTSMAVKETSSKCQRIAAANHMLGSTIDCDKESGKITKSMWKVLEESKSRRQAFLDQTISIKDSIKKVLSASGKSETIQSMVFDTVKGEISLSSKGSYAASGKFKTFESDVLFNTHQFNHSDSTHRMRLFRNLDWPWYFLGQETIVLTRPHSNGNSTVSVTWPGYIGSLSGMNNQGLALTLNQCDDKIKLPGIPNPLLFTDVLDTCKDISEASQVIDKGLHASSMNLMIADKTSAKSYELKGPSDFGEGSGIDAAGKKKYRFYNFSKNKNPSDFVSCVEEIH